MADLVQGVQNLRIQNQDNEAYEEVSGEYEELMDQGNERAPDEREMQWAGGDQIAPDEANEDTDPLEFDHYKFVDNQNSDLVEPLEDVMVLKRPDGFIGGAPSWMVKAIVTLPPGSFPKADPPGVVEMSDDSSSSYSSSSEDVNDM